MEEIQITGTGQAIGSVSFDINRSFLQRLFMQPKKRKIIITPTRLGVRHNYAKVMIQIPEEIFDTKDFSTLKIDKILSSDHADAIILGMAILIENKENKKPSKWLVDSLKKITQKEFEGIFALLLEALDNVSFLRSIIQINGFSLQTEEIITDKNETKNNEHQRD